MENPKPLEMIGAGLAEAAWEQDQAEAALHDLEATNEKAELAAKTRVLEADGRRHEFITAYLALGGEPGKFTGKGPDGKEITVFIPRPTVTGLILDNGRQKSGGKHVATKKAR
jgi:hypothetical protein